VEEGTTNLFTNPIFATGNESGFNYVYDWASRTIKDGGPFGKYIELVDTSTSIGYPYGAVFPVTEGQTYTFSVYANMLESNLQGACYLFLYWLDANNTIIRADTSDTLGEEQMPNFVGKGWRRYKITATAPTGVVKARAFVYSSLDHTGKVQLTGFQFEQKPFATSFTEGTRPLGRFYIPLDRLGFDPATDNWVVAYWKKPTGTHNGTLYGYNTCSFGRYTVDNSVGYIWWGKEYNQNIFRLNILLKNQVPTGATSSPFDPNWFFNNWHFEVLKREDNIVSYYVDGELKCQVTLTEPLQSFNYGLSLACLVGSAHTSLLANILLSRDPSVWTDDYIRTIYQAKKPFAVPPKLPIV